MAFRKSLVASLIFFSVQSLDMPDPHERQDVYTSMDGFLKFNINNCRSLKQDESDRQENLRKCYRKRVADPAITCPFKKVLQDIFNGMIGSSKETHYDIARKYFTVVKKPSELKSSVQLFLFVDEKRRDIPESNLYRDAKLHFSQEDPAFLLTAIVLLARCPVP